MPKNDIGVKLIQEQTKWLLGLKWMQDGRDLQVIAAFASAPIGETSCDEEVPPSALEADVIAYGYRNVSLCVDG